MRTTSCEHMSIMMLLGITSIYVKQDNEAIDKFSNVHLPLSLVSSPHRLSKKKNAVSL